ncbi:MAG: glycosyltransferase family 2 protein [Planctomycetales bacterium]|nr:glycosyltransferase family 2 protein [Planctomycetales bacterium]
MKPIIGVVAIGRNEGPRLQRCLESLAPLSSPTIYVDSGSTDDSVARAESMNVSVWKLDPQFPFTAARARREGFEKLLSLHPPLKYVFFVDGDCEVDADWLPTALAFLEAHADVAGVCGRRRERHPDQSAYNLSCDLEWDSPIGPCEAMGGDAVYRTAAYVEVGGFDPSVPAGEEPELCGRLRRQGWKLFRLDAPMTIHDAAMTQWKQWWRRQVRTGYGGWDVERRFSLGIFDRIVTSAYFWGAGYPAASLLASLGATALWNRWAGAATAGVALLGWTGQTLRIARHIHRRGYPSLQARRLARLLMLAKPAIAWGALRAKWDCVRGHSAKLIEYKRGAPTQAS